MEKFFEKGFREEINGLIKIKKQQTLNKQGGSKDSK
jgi:hypothetical protein